MKIDIKNKNKKDNKKDKRPNDNTIVGQSFLEINFGTTIKVKSKLIIIFKKEALILK